MVNSVPCGVIAVIRTKSRAEAALVVSALADAEVDAIEITLTVPEATQVISEFADIPVPVGAGTVLDPGSAARCIQAGARFLVSPTLDSEVCAAANQAGIPMIAGAMTPNEILRASSLSDAVKVFPINSVGGSTYVKAMADVFPMVCFVASGGIEPGHVRQFLSAGCRAVCLGDALIDGDALASRRVHDLTAYAKAQIAVCGRT